jgi:hypothetical protein
MKKKIVFLTLCFPVCMFGQQLQDSGPVDANALLTSLHTIQKKQETGSKTDKLQYAQHLFETAASPSAALGYYSDAVRAVRFAGQTQQGTEYLAWKNGEAGRLKSKAFLDSLTLHLDYLALTMQRSAGTEVKDLLPPLLSYIQRVQSADAAAPSEAVPPRRPAQAWRKRGNGQNANAQAGQQDAQDNGDAPDLPAGLDKELMRSDLNESIFVRWMLLNAYLDALGDNWEMIPGNIDGIYEKVILPEYRRTKDPRLIQYWDARIQREAEQATATGRSFDADKFNQTERPMLMWKRAEDLGAIGLRNREISEMVAIIKEYPSDPSIPTWVAEVEKMLKTAAAAPAAPAAAAPAPVTVTPPPQQPAGTPVAAGPSTPPQG